MKTGELNFEEAREALEQLYESSNEQRRFVLRLYVLYAFNDKYLDSLEPVKDYENEVRCKIRERALAGDRKVFAL